MAGVKITPHRLCGTVTAPPSKSAAHRAIICASLAKGKSRVERLGFSDDIYATVNAMRSLGAHIEIEGDTAYIDGTHTFEPDNADIDCNMSGSTLRFIIPVALCGGVKTNFTGKDSLFRRPLDVYYDIMHKQGIDFSLDSNVPSLALDGKLQPGEFTVPGDVSSQFITGLLFALPLLDGDSKILLTTPMQSKGYVDMTIAVLADFGIKIDNIGYQQFVIKGNQTYKSCNYTVEGDYSGAAFFLCAGALGNDVLVKGLRKNSLQADKAILSIFAQAGCMVEETDNGIKVVPAAQPVPLNTDGSECPDIIPVAAATAAVFNGTSHFINCARLRIKECDRLLAMAEGLSALGIDAREDTDCLAVTGGQVRSGRIRTFADHRISMTFAILSTVADGEIYIDDKDCVAKSYPSFWEDFTALGGIIHDC